MKIDNSLCNLETYGFKHRTWSQGIWYDKQLHEFQHGQHLFIYLFWVCCCCCFCVCARWGYLRTGDFPRANLEKSKSPRATLGKKFPADEPLSHFDRFSDENTPRFHEIRWFREFPKPSLLETSCWSVDQFQWRKNWRNFLLLMFWMEFFFFYLQERSVLE